MSRANTEWVCSIADRLSVGDEVLVNERSRPLTVTDRDIDRGSGPDYPHKHVWLEGNGTEYRLRYSHTKLNIPVLHTRSNWTERELPNGGTKIETDTKSGEDVKTLKPVDGVAVAVSDVSAAEFIEPTIAESTVAEDYKPPERDVESDGDELGECPDCGSAVVEDQSRATCSGCELWCPIDEWEAYHE